MFIDFLAEVDHSKKTICVAKFFDPDNFMVNQNLAELIRKSLVATV